MNSSDYGISRLCRTAVRSVETIYCYYNKLLFRCRTHGQSIIIAGDY